MCGLDMATNMADKAKGCKGYGITSQQKTQIGRASGINEFHAHEYDRSETCLYRIEETVHVRHAGHRYTRRIKESYFFFFFLKLQLELSDERRLARGSRWGAQTRSTEFESIFDSY
jgi:hypothetical protein